MATMSVPQFVEFVRRSQLVEEGQLEQALADFRQAHAGQTADDARLLAEFLQERKLLTAWHCEKLFDRKYKGFFLGKYKLLDRLGAGGMSAVYLAQHTMMHRLHAIKVLPRDRVEDSSYLARFKREAKAAAALDHPNIVRAYDIDNQKDQYYLVMEYVRGRDLSEIVKDLNTRGELLDVGLAADYIAQSADGLQHAHDAGLVHRDIKPANLLVDERGVVKILDMGLALFSEDDTSSLTITHNENVLGTADYLAPEQALSSHNVDRRADIYSLGCTFYFLLTGRPPFNEGSLAQRIAKHQNEKPPNIRELRPDCPPELIAACERMMEKKADDRFQSAAEVAETLFLWLDEHRSREPIAEAAEGDNAMAAEFAALAAAVEGRRTAGGSGSSAGSGSAGGSSTGPRRLGSGSGIGRRGSGSGIGRRAGSGSGIGRTGSGTGPSARPPEPRTPPTRTGGKQAGSSPAVQGEVGEEETLANRGSAVTDKLVFGPAGKAPSGALGSGKGPPAAAGMAGKTQPKAHESGEIDLGDLGQLLEAASGKSGRRSGRRSGVRRSQPSPYVKWAALALGGVAILVMVIVLALLYGESPEPERRRVRDTSTGMVSQPHKIPMEIGRCNGVARNDLRRDLKTVA